jgi:hypothetical protein
VAEKASVPDKPKTKDSPKHVRFPNWEEQEKNREEAIQARLERFRKAMEAAKREGHKAEMERLRIRTRQVMDSPASYNPDEDEDENQAKDERDNEGKDGAEDKEEDEGGSEGGVWVGVEGEDNGGDENEDDPEDDFNDSLYEDGDEGEGEDEDKDDDDDE